MIKKMEDEYGLVKKVVPLGIEPDDKTSPQAHILVT
jgi:hypothetical protein